MKSKLTRIEPGCLQLDGGGRNLIFGSGQQQEEAQQEFLAKLAVLNQAYIDSSAGRPFFQGDTLGFVDIVFGPLFFLFEALEKLSGLKIPDRTEWPRFHQWIDAVGEHPCVKPLRPDPHKQAEYFKIIAQRLASTGVVYK